MLPTFSILINIDLVDVILSDAVFTGSHEISPEDLQTICKLYQKCPKLWDSFRNVISFLDLLTENPQAYQQLYQHLVRMGLHIEGESGSDSQEDDFLLFAVAVGFVEHIVQFSRQIMREMGKTYNTEFPSFSRMDIGFDMRCLHIIRNHLLNITSHSSQFRLRLAQTGFLEDLAEDIKHIKHQSAEVLVSISAHVWLDILPLLSSWRKIQVRDPVI